MKYIYHGVPEEIIGDKLIPLSDIHKNNPKLWAEYLEKYIGREEILERRIPLVDCLWNDVLQFLPLHPRKIFELQVDMKIIPKIPNYKYFKIKASSLDPKKTVVYFKTAPGEKNVTVKWLNEVDLRLLEEIPQATIDYYKTLVDSGESPFNYQFVPHILHTGKVDISNSKIISIN